MVHESVFFFASFVCFCFNHADECLLTVGGLTAAAQRLLDSLPEDLEPAIASLVTTDDAQETAVLPSRLSSALTELEHFKTFFGSLDAYDACRRWVPPPSCVFICTSFERRALYSNDVDCRSSRLDQAPAVDELKVLTQHFYEAALSIFTEEWLELDPIDELMEDDSGVQLVAAPLLTVH